MATGKPLLKEKDKKKKLKKKSISKLKKELDKIFSLYVRQKESDKEGYAQCFTCGTRRHFRELQCGHFVSRVYLPTRYSEDNCRPQCVGCNVFGKGKTAEFAAHLERVLGKEIVPSLFRQARVIIKNYPYQEKIEYYTNKLKELITT